MKVSDDVLDTVSTVSYLFKVPLEVKESDNKLELVSDTNKIAKVNNEQELFRLLQGMMLGFQYHQVIHSL